MHKYIFFIIFLYLFNVNIFSNNIVSTNLKNKILSIIDSGSIPISVFPNSKEPQLIQLNNLFQKGFYLKPNINITQITKDTIICEFSNFYIKGLSIETANVETDLTLSKWNLNCTINCDDLYDLIKKELGKLNMSLPSFRTGNDYLYANGHTKFLNLNIEVKTKAKFEFDKTNTYAYIKMLSLKLGRIPSPSFIRGKIMKQFNPIIGLNDNQKIQWYFNTVKLNNNKINFSLKGITKRN